MLYVEKLKFKDNPIDKEYHKQKMAGAKWQCRHLKGIRYVELCYGDDHCESFPHCILCGKQLSDTEIDEINKTIAKFKKLK